MKKIASLFSISHKIDPHAQEFIAKELKKLKPRIGPWHLLGASTLAGLGMAAGGRAFNFGSEVAGDIVEDLNTDDMNFDKRASMDSFFKGVERVLTEGE